MKRQVDYIKTAEASGEIETDANSVEETERLAREIIEYGEAPEEPLDYLDGVNKYPPPLRIQINVNGTWHYLQYVHGNNLTSTHYREDAMLASKLDRLRERFPGLKFRVK